MNRLALDGRSYRPMVVRPLRAGLAAYCALTCAMRCLIASNHTEEFAKRREVDWAGLSARARMHPSPGLSSGPWSVCASRIVAENCVWRFGRVRPLEPEEPPPPGASFIGARRGAASSCGAVIGNAIRRAGSLPTACSTSAAAMAAPPSGRSVAAGTS